MNPGNCETGGGGNPTSLGYLSENRSFAEKDWLREHTPTEKHACPLGNSTTGLTLLWADNLYRGHQIDLRGYKYGKPVHVVANGN